MIAGTRNIRMTVASSSSAMSRPNARYFITTRSENANAADHDGQHQRGAGDEPAGGAVPIRMASRGGHAAPRASDHPGHQEHLVVGGQPQITAMIRPIIGAIRGCGCSSTARAVPALDEHPRQDAHRGSSVRALINAALIGSTSDPNARNIRMVVVIRSPTISGSFVEQRVDAVLGQAWVPPTYIVTPRSLASARSSSIFLGACVVDQTVLDHPDRRILGSLSPERAFLPHLRRVVGVGEPADRLAPGAHGRRPADR